MLFHRSFRQVLATRLVASIFALAMVHSALAQSLPPKVDIQGEASVVIFENFETGDWEIRYFIIEAQGGFETEVKFKGAAPEQFRTGAMVQMRGERKADGFSVDSMELLSPAPWVHPDDASVDAAVAPPETRNVLTILTDFNDAVVDGFKADGVTPMNYGISLQEAKDRMFNQTKSVAGLFYNASLGTLTIPPDPDNDGIEDVFGPYQINDSYIGGDSAQCTASTWVNLASAAWEAANPTKDINIYRHRHLIVPNYWDWSNRHCTWGGVAQLGCGSWCWAIGADPDSIFHGVTVHELGHNLGLHHARTDTNNDGNTDSEYGDSSDMMGGSRNWMKFNPPHAEDKGWHDPSDYEIRTIVPSASAQSFDLIPIDEEVWDWPGLRAVKVERTSNTDYYLSYRLATGEYNNVSSAYRNRLSIHYGYDGSTASYFVTSLGVGESYNEPHNNLTISATGTMDVTGPAGTATVMNVEICQGPCSSIAAPSNLTATALSTSEIDLAWNDNSDNEDGFHVFHSTDGSSWSNIQSLSGTTWLHGGLATASTHHYRIQAYNVDEVSGYSNTAVETTDAIPPAASFTWSANYTDVSFTDTSSDPDGTVVGWSWNFGDGSSSSQQNPGHTYAGAGEYTVDLTVTDNHGATSFASQQVVVEDPPFSDHLATADSNEGGTVSGDYTATHGDDGVTQSITERESGGKPSNRHDWLGHQWQFQIPAGGSATVYVNAWQSASSDGDNFDFSWSSNGSSWTPMLTVSATSDPGTPQSFSLPPGTSGTVFVRVADTDQTSGNRANDTVFVDQLRIRVENASSEPVDGDPTNLVATADGFDQISLTFDDGSTNESGFRIMRREVGGVFAEVGQAGANAGSSASYVDNNGLNGGTTYEYQVIGFNLVDESNPSNIASATTDPAPDIVLNASGRKEKGKHIIDLDWTSSGGGNMDVYRDGELVASNVASPYSDATGNKGGGSYNHQVCETGSLTACSNITTTVF